MMETVVTVFNTKGGTGKTTIADELVFNLPQPVSFLNLDAQPGALHESVEHQDSIIVADTPGRIEPGIEPVLERASVTVVPFIPSHKGLAALPEALSRVKHNPLLVLNTFDGRLNVHREVVERVKSEYGLPFVTVPRSTLFDQAAMQGKSVVDLVPNSKPAVAITLLASRVLTMIGES